MLQISAHSYSGSTTKASASTFARFPPPSVHAGTAAQLACNGGAHWKNSHPFPDL